MTRRPAAVYALCLALLALVAATAATLTERDQAFIGNRRTWWAFQKPVRPAMPGPAGQNPVDAFLGEAQRTQGLTGSAEASRAALLRRVTLDLTGLPPAPADVAAFLADRSPNAYERVVDRLIASPRYGERWAQRWLDVVRYADTNGFELDEVRPNAWRYRDYVIRAFNSGKPFDRFIQEQLAGDELWPGNAEALIATGLLRAGPEHLVGGNQDVEMNRQEVLTEMTTIVGSAFLGMTLQCARCHNHKFDPIPQSDHYRLQAVFAATAGADVVYASEAERKAAEEAKKRYKARLEPLEKAIKGIEKPYRTALEEEKKQTLDAAHLAAFAKPKKERTPAEETLAKEARDQIEPTWDEVLARVPAVERAKRAELRRQLHEIELEEPEAAAAAYAVKNLEQAPETHILKIGDHKQKLDAVPAGLPQVLVPPDAAFPQTPSGRRSALAQWLVSKDHPLTARVMVNRIWQFRFGAGLVGTPNDFGLLGARPTHPKLLDWLAVEFIENGWSIKAIDRLLVTSAAYRQSSSATDPSKAKIDPANRYYWHMNKRRLEGEAIRDSILAVSGALRLDMYGPPVRTPLEPEVYDLIFSEYERDNLWPLPSDRTQVFRRSVYLMNKRTVRLPLLANFDQPDAMTSCAARSVSTHALQALNLMNSEFIRHEAQRFAARIQSKCGAESCRVEEAYSLALGRPAREAERKMAHEYLRSGGDWVGFAQAMLNRNEFVYVP